MQHSSVPDMAKGYDNTGKPRKTLLEEAFSFSFSGKKSTIPDRIAMLGIPEEELTESVTLAISALFEKTDDLRMEREQAQEKLAELESLVDVDFLAPIPNRRAFMRRLNWVISMLNRYKHPSSITFFDLNRFKEINDTYGHAAGDMAIRHVADVLTAAKRESDFLARLGGDEFAIILYYADAGDANKRAQEIATRIATTPFTFNGHQLFINAAVGTHAIRSGETAEEALHAADQSMYINKKENKAKDLSDLNV